MCSDSVVPCCAHGPEETDDLKAALTTTKLGPLAAASFTNAWTFPETAGAGLPAAAPLCRLAS